jgi:hypothetical protein
MSPFLFCFLPLVQTQAPSPDPKPAPADPSPAPAPLEGAGTKISVYGIIHMDAYGGTARVNHHQFTYYALSPAGLNEKGNWIDWTPRLSRLGVRATRDSLPFWESARAFAQFEFDFQNRATSEAAGTESESRELPRLRHAFVRLTADPFSVLAGQTSDLISPLFPAANYDGVMWNAGNLGDRRPQIRFGGEDRAFDGAWNAAVALARTGAVDRKNLDGALGDTERDGDDSALPMLQARLGLASLFDKRLDIGVWGHLGWEETQVPIAGEDEFRTAGFGADVKIKLLDTLTLSAEVWRGQNLSDLRGGIDQGVNVATGDEITSTGGWAEAAFKVADPLTLHGGVAVDDPADEDLTAGTQRSRNLAPFAVGKVDLGGGFHFGLEWIQWRTEYLGVGEGRADRWVLFAAFAF